MPATDPSVAAPAGFQLCGACRRPLSSAVELLDYEKEDGPHVLCCRNAPMKEEEANKKEACWGYYHPSCVPREGPRTCKLCCSALRPYPFLLDMLRVPERPAVKRQGLSYLVEQGLRSLFCRNCGEGVDLSNGATETDALLGSELCSECLDQFTRKLIDFVASSLGKAHDFLDFALKTEEHAGPRSSWEPCFECASKHPGKELLHGHQTNRSSWCPSKAVCRPCADYQKAFCARIHAGKNVTSTVRFLSKGKLCTEIPDEERKQIEAARARRKKRREEKSKSNDVKPKKKQKTSKKTKSSSSGEESSASEEAVTVPTSKSNK
jgi:hypothetical protein